MLNDEVFEQWCRDLGLSEQTKELIAHKQRLKSHGQRAEGGDCKNEHTDFMARDKRVSAPSLHGRGSLPDTFWDARQCRGSDGLACAAPKGDDHGSAVRVGAIPCGRPLASHMAKTVRERAR